MLSLPPLISHHPIAKCSGMVPVAWPMAMGEIAANLGAFSLTMAQSDTLGLGALLMSSGWNNFILAMVHFKWQCSAR